ncbi:MAG: hypothetical protein LBJ35_00320 [Spirochaetaceae bacterium]|jgi:hypothetical protein|nr:hypothetical protein [Spirochaetaceae bacterium]
MTKKLYAAVTAALLGLAMSCGEAGEDIAGLIQGINNGETQATSVFVQFNGGAGKPAAQKFDFFRTAGEPVITFTNPEISSKEDWLALKEKTGYDFVNDPEGLGPNWGGGGMKLN